MPGRTISTISVLVDDHALARRRLVGDHAGLGDGVALQHVDAARRRIPAAATAGSAAPETSPRLIDETSLPDFCRGIEQDLQEIRRADIAVGLADARSPRPAARYCRRRRESPRSRAHARRLRTSRRRASDDRKSNCARCRPRESRPRTARARRRRNPRRALPARRSGPATSAAACALPGGVTLKPPNGGFSFCSAARSDLRNTGSFASAAREVTDFGSMPARCFAQPGAVSARAMSPADCAN